MSQAISPVIAETNNFEQSKRITAIIRAKTTANNNFAVEGNLAVTIATIAFIAITKVKKVESIKQWVASEQLAKRYFDKEPSCYVLYGDFIIIISFWWGFHYLYALHETRYFLSDSFLL